MLYVFGRHDAIGLTLMGVERATTPDEQLMSGCEMITQLAPLITKHQGDGSMSAVMLGTNDPPQKVQVGNYTMQVTRMRLPALRRRSGQAPRRRFSLRSGLTNTMPWAITSASPFLPTRRDPGMSDSARWKKARSSMAVGFPAANSRAMKPARETICPCGVIRWIESRGMATWASSTSPSTATPEQSNQRTLP